VHLLASKIDFVMLPSQQPHLCACHLQICIHFPSATGCGGVDIDNQVQGGIAAEPAANRGVEGLDAGGAGV
jgi:hypothetical protein